MHRLKRGAGNDAISSLAAPVGTSRKVCQACKTVHFYSYYVHDKNRCYYHNLSDPNTTEMAKRYISPKVTR